MPWSSRIETQPDLFADGGEVLVGDEILSVNGTGLRLLSGSEVRQLPFSLTPNPTQNLTII